MTAGVLNPGGSTPFNLTLLGEALERRMVEIFTDFRLRVSNPDVNGVSPAPEVVERVSVYVGSVKSRERADDATEKGPRFPFVLVDPNRLLDEEGESGCQRTTAEVEFLVGVRRLSNDGKSDVTAIVERIRTNLLRYPVIEERARMELPLDSKVGGDESFPHWYGIVSAQFNIPQPVEETGL